MSVPSEHAAPPCGGDPLRSDTSMDASDGSEWSDLLELLPLWGDNDLDDALFRDDMTGGGGVERSAVGANLSDSASRPERPSEGMGRQIQRYTKKLSTRAQRALEIRRLRKECKDRYETLLALREEVKAARRTSGLHTSPSLLSKLASDGKQSQSANTHWMTEAEKQRKLLALVESVNNELRNEVRLQKREAQSLHRVLSKRISSAQALWNSLFASVDAMPTPLSLSPSILSDTRTEYAKLLQETEAMRPKTDLMLQYIRSKVAFPMANGSFREWKTTYWSPDSTAEEDMAFTEMIDVEELPFPIPNVCNAIDNMYRTYEMDNFAKQNFNVSDDTIMATSFFTYGHGENTMHSQLQQVAQHFTTDTYTAFVSTFTVDFLAESIAEKIPVGKMQEWRIISNSDDGTTLHQTIAVMMPQIAGAKPSPSSSMTFLELLADGWLTSFSCTSQHIENHLVSPPSPSSVRTLRRKGPWPLDGRHMSSSQPEDATPAPPPDGALPRADAAADEREWLALLELLPLAGGGDDLGDTLCLRHEMDGEEERHALDGDASRRPPQPEGSRGRKRRRRNTLGTRTQRAIEINRLQNECRDLVETLSALREMVKVAGLPPYRPRSVPGGLDDAKERSQLACTRWVTEAGRQHELLVLAVHANRELKRELHVQKREARSLHRVLTKRIADAKALWNRVFASVDAIPTMANLSSTVFSDTRLAFAGLLQETEAMRPSVDAIRACLGSTVAFPVADGSFQEWKMTRCSNEQVTAVVELIDVQELPFSIPNVRNAVENMYRTYEMDDFAKQHFDTSDGTIMATSFFTYDHGEGNMYARLQQVVQHFTTDTYTAFVSTFVVKSTTRTPAARVPVSKMQEWRVVSASDDGATLHQTFAVMMPLVVHSMPSPYISKHVMDQLIEQWLASFSCTNQQIENLLMNPPSSSTMRALRRKRSQLHNWSQFHIAPSEAARKRAYV